MYSITQKLVKFGKERERERERERESHGSWNVKKKPLLCEEKKKRRKKNHRNLCQLCLQCGSNLEREFIKVWLFKLFSPCFHWVLKLTRNYMGQYPFWISCRILRFRNNFCFSCFLAWPFNFVSPSHFPFTESFSETNYLILSTLYIFFKDESIRDRELYIYIYIWAIFAFFFFRCCDLGTFVCLF